MPKFNVMVREVHVSHRHVNAEGKEEAIEKVANCDENDEVYLEYSHTLDSETWTVEEVKDE